MDQRSKLLNTEMGVIVDSPGLAKAVADFFDRATAPENAFRVELKAEPHGRPDIVWVTLEQGRMQTFEHEPGASAHRKVEAMFLKLLPIDGLL
jgi:putative cardiolipin synthase